MRQYSQNEPSQNGRNSAMVVLVSVLGTLVVVLLILGILLLSGAFPFDQYNSESSFDAVGLTTADPSTGTTPVTMYVANVENSVYFRSTPVEDDSNIITTIGRGTAVTFLDNANEIFAKIQHQGQEGYVKREYLSSSIPTASPKPASAYSGDTSVKYYTYVANVENSIYLRSNPSEGDNIICTIPVGTGVGFIESTNSVFSKIKYGDLIGYAKSAYLSTSGSSYRSDDTMVVCNVENSIYLRSTPAENPDNIITTIPVGSTVRYLGQSGIFYKISWNGYVGYGKAEYLR